MNVVKQPAHPDGDIAQVLTPVVLPTGYTGDDVEHTVLIGQIDEPLGVQDVALRQVVRAAHSRFGRH